MQEVSGSQLVIALGGILVMAGIVQIFLQTISVQRGKRGRIRSGFRLRKLSSIYPGVILIVIGALLLGGGSFVDAL
jgi:dipeptide/tripeptide permease